MRPCFKPEEQLSLSSVTQLMLKRKKVSDSRSEAFVSWSGGKETSLACYRVMKSGKCNIRCLLNMVSEDGKRSRSHGIRVSLLRLQSEALGIPVIQKRTTWGNYEEVFKRAVSGLRKQGIDTGIFGDIDIAEHRDWVEKVCGETGIKPLFPLWQENREKLLEEFINTGFMAVIVAAKAGTLGDDWLGLEIGDGVVQKLKSLSGIDLCGEKGEYHTLVTDGPIFKKKLRLLKSRKVQRSGQWFLDILRFRLEDK